MEKRIFELTVSEFMELLKQQTNVPTIVEQKAETKMLYSIKELATFLQCSTVTAQKLKNSGRIPFAQTGRKCVFNGDAVMGAISHKLKSQRV
ncbi:MAG: helix-turn-helix domain-containing protein [Bacteroidales bacterium]